ncbi:uncharacterized protein LOC129882695 isoform X2 [Solanum dulcamara]|uniref:uncharacterized protein LOC129882695 isoform X2 n=1 Tax=Solanum dulcamara TaxID=45834 RepID=UPI002484F18D|nr:uncharacterized protein LOC129882695 isoform X2 [Solanum dulcamara]
MMDDPERVILDISSDEEVGFVKSRGGDGGGGKGSDDYDWITELLGEGGDGRSKDDSDDVVVVGEVIMNPKQNLKALTNANDDDDDCVVLEEDPDKPVEVNNDRGDDSDDLLVVSEKGQSTLGLGFPHLRSFMEVSAPDGCSYMDSLEGKVLYLDKKILIIYLGSQVRGLHNGIACRDYPHSRHLCAKFPFGSTPHERHCDQCHCYVCDTLAPCVYWRTGISSTAAHCHATDKDKFWKAQRQSTRKSDKALPVVTPCRGTSVSVPPPVAHQAPGFIQRLGNYPPHNQTLRQAPIRPCSMSSSPGLPNSTRQLPTALRDKFHSHVVSQQLRNASINVNPGDRRHNVGHMGPQFFTTRTAFKRAGSSGQAFATDRSRYNSPNTCSVPQFGRTHSSAARWKVPCGSRPVGSSKYIASSQHNAGIAVSYQPPLQRQPGFVGVPSNYAPMGPQIPSQPHAGILGPNAVSSQHQLPRQPALVGAPANYAPMEPEIPSQPSVGVVGANAVSFQPPLPRQPRFVGASTNYAPMEPQIPSQPQVSVCANSVSSEAPTFFLPYANSSPSQPHLSTLPSVLSEFESLVSSENSVSSQSQVGNMYNNPLSSEAQMFSQQYADGNSANSLPQQTSVAFHLEGGNTSVNTTASQYLLACPANAGTALGNSTIPVSQLSNQPDGGTSPNSSVPGSGDLPSPVMMESTFGRCENTLSCQPELCRQHISSSSSSNSQNISQHGYQETPEVSRHPQLMENITDLDIQYDDWLVSGPSDAPVLTGFNILSPEAPPIDSGFFVDF